jgi:hypothetical protein
MFPVGIGDVVGSAEGPEAPAVFGAIVTGDPGSALCASPIPNSEAFRERPPIRFAARS